ncbi:MAG TPA: TIGR04053 family radical SAM/SPASM domain-containing protein [Chloroflexota bacterium]|nr:TIGR04053 family radical SAM/SPASM domain-containing protein [Chloroflexota bacterium]
MTGSQVVAGHHGMPALSDIDFDKTPFTVAWEITEACGLACVHCRASAQPKRDPRELTTEEGYALLDGIKEMGNPILVVTGGDPLMRRDVFDLIRYGAGKGLRVSLSPSATGLLNEKNLQKAKDAGVVRIHLSLDGSTPEIHDAFRQVHGSFARTLKGIEIAKEIGMSLQIGTTVTRRNLEDLPALAELMVEFGALMWNIFFLVPTGRGKESDMITPEQHEATFQWMYDLSKSAPYDVRTTAAQHYRRVVFERTRAELGEKGAIHQALSGAGYSFQDGLGRPQQGVNDGKGFCFISHIGDVCPSGFLQLPAGNVREQPIYEIYRNSKLFKELRDPSLLKGRCGRCEYRRVCGGSRARGWALTGDYLAEEICCTYEPQSGHVL